MTEVVLTILGTGVLMVFEKDLKRLRHIIPKRIKKIHHKLKKGEYGWEDYTIVSLCALGFSLAFILIRYS